MPYLVLNVYLRGFTYTFMIVEFLLIPCLFVSFAGWGAWAKMLTGIKTDSFSLSIILGFSLFSILTCCLSFFIPLNFYAELVLLLLSLFPFFLRKMRNNMIRFPKELWRSAWFWIFCVVILLAGSFHPFRPDYFSYYKPSINWLDQYGLIIGVANIDWNFGQMSALHIIQAGLDETLDPFQRIGIFITILFLTYIFEKKNYLLLFIIPVFFLFIQTPSTDLAIVFLSLIVVNELCFNYHVENYKLLFLISVFTFVIKPVAFWLPVWTFAAGLLLNKKELRDFRIYLIPTLLVIIFLVKNVIASSTLLYPLPFTKLNTYWLPNFQILDLSNQRASIFTFGRYFTINEINSMSFFQKVYYWLSIDKLQTIINCFMVAAIAVFGVFAFLKKNILYIALWIIVVVKSLVVFSFSGQFRFIIDGVFPLLFILFYPVLTGKTKILISALAFSFMSLFLISYPSLLKQNIPGFKLTKWMKGFKEKSLLLPENYTINKYAVENIGNINFYISSFIYNYDTPPPAFSEDKLREYYQFGIFPQMEDVANIRKGYYMKMLTPEEKAKLGEIIDKYFATPENQISHSSR